MKITQIFFLKSEPSSIQDKNRRDHNSELMYTDYLEKKIAQNCKRVLKIDCYEFLLLKAKKFMPLNTNFSGDRFKVMNFMYFNFYHTEGIQKRPGKDFPRNHCIF